MPPISLIGSPTAELLKRSQPLKQAVGNLILAKEGSNGVSHMTCLQDTLVALVPRAMISRSKAEGVEVGFLEVLESLLIYYSVPLLGGKFFRKVMGKIGAKNFDVKDLTRSLDQLGHVNPEQMKHLLPAKAALIITALTLTGVGGEYIINYAKNLVTAHYFKKDKFSDIVNLSKGEMPSNEESDIVKKSKQRIYGTLMVCGGLLAGALSLARFGHKLPKWIMEGPLRDGVKTFDFNFKNGAFGLTKQQMGAYMCLSIPAYLDSARDKMETYEVASRLAIVLPYLLMGQDWLEKLIREKFPAITADAGNGALRVKSLDELAVDSITKAAERHQIDNFNISKFSMLPKNVLEEAAHDFQKPLQSKIAHVAIPLGIGVFGTGAGVGLLIQYWSKQRFKRQLEQNQSSLQPPIPSQNQSVPVQTPVAQTMPMQMPMQPTAVPQPSFPSAVVGQSPFHRPLFQNRAFPEGFAPQAKGSQQVYVS